MSHFDTLKNIAVENIVRKGEIVCKRNFSISHNVFYPIWYLLFILKGTLKCLQFVSIWTSPKILLSGNGLNIDLLQRIQ